MTEEYVVISVTREDLEDYLFNALGAELEGGLTDEDVEAIAFKFSEQLEGCSAVIDCHYSAIVEVLGERLKEN